MDFEPVPVDESLGTNNQQKNVSVYLVRVLRIALAPTVGFWLMLNYIDSVWRGDFDHKPDTFGDEL